MQDKPKILMFGPSLTATSGISAVVNNWLEAGMAEKVDLDYIPTLIHYVPGRYVGKFLDALRSYCHLLVKSLGPIDIVHIHLSSGMSFYRKLIIFRYARLRRLKTAVHLHGSTFEKFYEDGTRFQKKLIRSLFDCSDAILVLSQAWKAFVRSISTNKNIYIIYNGASLSKFSPKIDNAEETVIAFMGRLGMRKGTYDLLEAFEQLSGEVPEAHLVLGGDGDVDEVKSIVKKKKMAHRVDVLGWVSGPQKIEIFKRADIYALPSYNEGLPGSILEAMAAGVPIISTPVGGIAEAVIEGKNGFLIEPGDVEALHLRLLTLCRDKKLRERMGRESIHLIRQKFDIEKILIDVLEVYQKMLIS